MDRSFLQTVEWLAFQRSLGRKVWRLDDGFLKAGIIRHDVRMGQNYLYAPYGPELNLDLATDGLRNDISHFVRHLRQLARHEGSMFIKLEPMHDMAVELLMRHGLHLRKSRQSIQPRSTIVIDLVQTPDALLDALHHKHRYNINLAERKGVTIEPSDDIDAFLKLLKKTAEHDDFRTHDAMYYRKLLRTFSSPDGPLRARLYLAHYGGQPVAGAVIMEHAGNAYYLHGASDRDQRVLMAPHLLHWRLIQQYKVAGYARYDLWGLDADQYPGVTRFKIGFGGQVVEYPGSFDLVFKPFWYWLYKLAPR
jgi:peptidoglycan pentaglycine glycine transferase (the first glycine)